jgi:hypothetical protein
MCAPRLIALPVGWLIIVLLLTTLAVDTSATAIWRSMRNFSWFDTGTMDTAVINENSGVYVTMKYTYLSGGGLFYYIVPDAAPVHMEHVYIAVHSVQYPGANVDDDALRLLDAINAHNASYGSINAPDTKILHIITNGSDVCLSLFRFADSVDPCLSGSMLTAESLAVGVSDFITFNVDSRPNAIIAMQLQAFTYSLNATITIDNIPTYRLSVASYVADAVRGLRNNGTAMMFGGNGSIAIQRLEHKSTSFWCDPTETAYSLEFCVAPSMHLCKDLHYRAECKPMPDCHNGVYDRMQHACICDNNYAGSDCTILACLPACVFGTCNVSTNSCACWDEHAYGNRCEQYSTNNTNTTLPGNMTLITGAVILVYAGNSTSYIMINGTIIIQTGVQVVIMLSAGVLLHPGDRYPVLSYGGVQGKFDNVYVVKSDGSPLDHCTNYTVEYGNHLAELVFFDSCAGQDTVAVPWYVTFSIILAIVVVIVVFVLLARYNTRFQRFLLPFRKHLRVYRRLKNVHNVDDTTGQLEMAGQSTDNANNNNNNNSTEIDQPPVVVEKTPAGYNDIGGAMVLQKPDNHVVLGASPPAPAGRKIKVNEPDDTEIAITDGSGDNDTDNDLVARQVSTIPVAKPLQTEPVISTATAIMTTPTTTTTTTSDSAKSHGQ